MGRSQSFVGLLAVGVVAIPVMTTLACGPGWVEPPLEGSLDGGNGGGSSGKPGSNEEVPCGTVTKLEAIPDPSSLPACCQAEKGEAHCLAEDKATPGIKKSMGKCESGGYCVPDSILKSGGAKPKSCTSAFGPGGC